MANLAFFAATIFGALLALLYQRASQNGVDSIAPAVLIKSIKGRLGLLKERPLPAMPYRKCGHLATSSYSITSTRVVLPSGVQQATVTVVDGKIGAVALGRPAMSSSEVVLDFGNMVVSPGVIDVHSHLNEPGKEEWEGISTGTAAAAAGGVTTLVDMPLNSFPCTCTTELLRTKMTLAKAKSHVNMGFWAGLVPGNAFWVDKLDAMLNEGAVGFKAFLSPSGIDDFPNVARAHVAASLSLLKYKGVPLMLHAELVSDIGDPQGDPREYSTYLATRPPAFEQAAIHMLLELLVKHTPDTWNQGFRMHIAHLADASSLAMLKVAKRKLPVSAEACPHHLLFSAEEIPDGSTLHKCAPPIRSAANRDALLAGVVDGTLELVSSDHSPAPPSLKEIESGDFLKAWGGISGLQMLLPATWTALQPQGVSLAGLARLLSEQPAQLLGLSASTGSIEAGKDADFVVWDPEAATDTSPDSYLHKHKASPYLGMALKGAVHATFVHGNLVWSAEEGLTPSPCGRVVTPPMVRLL